MRKLYARAVVATASLVAIGAANAAAPDTSALTSASADIATVGAAVFTVIVGIKAIKWVRRAL